MSDHINAMPTKAFFVDMLVRDIPLDRAVLDLIDNCVDGAKRLRPGDPPDFSELWVKIEISADSFTITDNCGGFDTAIAREYAFRFGRPPGVQQTDYSIGQFGVGMKRALFKFGRHFEVYSRTAEETWSMHVNVDTWERDEDTWRFDFTDVDSSSKNDECGTKIVVKRLRPEVSSRFATEHFQGRLAEKIRSLQRQFMSSGLSIQFNGDHLINTDLRLLAGGAFQPAVEEFVLEGDSDTPIQIRIVAGIGESNPDVAGWYIVCNGRVILSADRSEATGWGSVAEQREQGGIPKYHNQYARFRGVAFFSCKSSKKLPWNTTKTGLDGSSSAWQTAWQKILDQTRVVIKYLNQLDRDIDEYGSGSPLLTSLNDETDRVVVESFTTAQGFAWNKNARPRKPPMTKIQYSREREKIKMLMIALGAISAKAVGEATFDAIYKEQQRKEDSE